MPILDTDPQIYKILIDHVPRDAVMDDFIMLCADFNDLHEIQIFLNPSKSSGENLQFAVISFTAKNEARKAITEFNGLILATQFENKKIRARWPLKNIAVTLDRPWPKTVRDDLVKNEIMSLIGNNFPTLTPFI